MVETNIQNQKINWYWLRNLLKIVEEYKSITDITQKIQESFVEYLKFETVEIFVIENPMEQNHQTSHLDKLSSASFFSREVIEEIFLHKKPRSLNSQESIFPLEAYNRIIGLVHVKSNEDFTMEQFDLLWSFCDRLAIHINDLLIPIKMTHEIKDQIRDISDSIFNNLKGFLEASLERLKILEEQNSQLMQLNEMRTELINNVSHELRTPLVSIMGFSKILQRREVDAALVKEASDQIQSAGSRLSRMIDDLIQLNRASNKGWDINLEKLDIGEIVRFVVESLSPLHKEHSFTFNYPEDYPLIDGDRKLLRQVIENLLLNAIKYSPDGGEINCMIVIEINSNLLSLSIKDEGIGMTKEEYVKVFDRFFRAKNPKTENIPGLGLGLSICKDVIEALNGTIECSSEFGQGSEFVIKLGY